MTSEDAIKELKILKEEYWDDDGYGHETKQYDDTMFALDMAIKALEQQPCEDCISRKAELDGLASIAKAKAKSDAQKALMGRVMFFTEQLPSVIPKYTDEEIDRAQAVEQAYIDKMVELTVEESKKVGHWINLEETKYKGQVLPFWSRYECSKCGGHGEGTSNYCPNCGAKMAESEELGGMVE